MTVRLSISNRGDRPSTDAELLGDNGHWFTAEQFPYTPNLRREKFSPSSFVGLPSFANLVIHVVLMGSKKEMPRIDTDFVVAPMKNLHPFWDRPSMDFPRNAVNRDNNLFSFGAYRDSAIPVYVVMTLPFPTAAHCLNSSEKPLFDGDSNERVAAADAAKLPLISVRNDDGATLLAGHIVHRPIIHEDPAARRIQIQVK